MLYSAGEEVCLWQVNTKQLFICAHGVDLL